MIPLASRWRRRGYDLVHICKQSLTGSLHSHKKTPPLLWVDIYKRREQCILLAICVLVRYEEGLNKASGHACLPGPGKRSIDFKKRQVPYMENT